jgi:hypothetical protein
MITGVSVAHDVVLDIYRLERFFDGKAISFERIGISARYSQTY